MLVVVVGCCPFAVFIRFFLLFIVFFFARTIAIAPPRAGDIRATSASVSVPLWSFVLAEEGV